MSELGNSETLTVSYGVFSCTLKGVEKPVEMMMEVTEYFRKLIATDHLFGAEPQAHEFAAMGQDRSRPALVG